MIVDLEWSEVAIACHEAVVRATSNKSLGTAQKHGMTNDFFSGLRIDVLGCLGEIAYAKGLNRFWSGQRGMHAPDVASCVEVKTIDANHKHLFILMDDTIIQPEISALAQVGVDPTRVALLGWTFTAEGKQEKNLFEPRPGSIVYRVRREHLRPVEELVRMLGDGDAFLQRGAA